MVKGMTKTKQLAASLALSLAAMSAIAAPPKVYTLDGDYLEIAKQRVSANDAQLKPAYDALIKSANTELAREPESVTQKGLTPGSGDKRDYMSMGPYWWPNPDTANHLPYIRKDGQTNPSSKNNDTDSVRMQVMCNGTYSLGLAYYFSGDKKYAEKAAAFIRTWFLDPKTRMNPNLRFGQGVPGVVDGRGIGLIDTRNFWMVIDTVGLIEPAKVLSKDETDELKKWFSEFTTWMIVSPAGHEEYTWHNNHGAYYDAQVANYALFIDDKQQAKHTLEDAIHLRMANHFAMDGKQYAELERTQPFHYSAFNLDAHMRLARYGEQVGVDYANADQDGRKLKTGVDFLVPYLKDPKSWPFKDLKGIAYDVMMPTILRAARSWPQDKAKYVEAMQTMPEKTADQIDRLVWPIK